MLARSFFMELTLWVVNGGLLFPHYVPHGKTVFGRSRVGGAEWLNVDLAVARHVDSLGVGIGFALLGASVDHVKLLNHLSVAKDEHAELNTVALGEEVAIVELEGLDATRDDG